MGPLFAAVLLLSSPGCPHEEPSCLTSTEYVEAKSLANGLLRQASHGCMAQGLVSSQMLHSHHHLRFAPLNIGQP
jgi:hypothetical protein